MKDAHIIIILFYTDCLPGFEFDETTKKCQTCAVGFYKDNEGENKCNACPADHLTFSHMSANATECSKFTH